MLEGCMAGRLAMNSPWELARIDREVFGDFEFNTMTREAILRDYAEFATIEQIEAQKSGYNLTNAILIRPLIYLFNGEWAGGDWRRIITELSTQKKHGNKVRDVILEAIEQFKLLNDEAL